MMSDMCARFKKLFSFGTKSGLCLFSLCFVIGGVASALDADGSQQRVDEVRVVEGKGWKLKSGGGLTYINPDNEQYWFALNGVLRFDQTLISGTARDRRSDFPSGGNARKIEIDVEGGLGKYWVYTVGLEFGVGGNQFLLSDSWLGYEGFCQNMGLYVGRHSGNWFGLENSTSTSWYPFLERSLAASAFYPGDGLGVLADMWWADAGVTLLVLKPEPGARIVSPNGQRYRDDPWMAETRLTYAPVHNAGDVWHFGLSAAYRRNDAKLNGVSVADLAYSTRPGMRARNTAQIVGTPKMSANYLHAFNVEAARHWGPVLIQGEYTTLFVHRVGDIRGSVIFNGWGVIAQYMITGETHQYDVRDGSFGKIDIKSKNGAVELAARYDGINLNDKNIRGGTAHNVTLGVNWYVNDNLRLSANYVSASLHPQNEAPKRRLEALAGRLQIKFK